MSLLTIERYRTLTHDNTGASAVVLAAIVDAEELLAEELRRPIVLAERTETCQVIDGRVYPIVTPVISVVGDYVVEDDDAISIGNAGASWGDMPISLVDGLTGEIAITYTGGWTSETVPVTIERAIAEAAKVLVTQAPSVTTEWGNNVTALRNGDVAVSFGKDGAGALSDPLGGAAVFKACKRYGWRPS